MNKLKYRILLFAFFLAFAGCNNNKFFELQNPPEFPWLNMEELERGVVTPYNFAFTNSWSNFFGDDRLIFECMSDAVYLLPNTSADIPFEEMYLRTTAVEMTKANSGFSLGYKCITHANSVLDFLAENDYQPFKTQQKETWRTWIVYRGKCSLCVPTPIFTFPEGTARYPGPPTLNRRKSCLCVWKRPFQPKRRTARSMSLPM